jgi:hypothetical protein
MVSSDSHIGSSGVSQPISQTHVFDPSDEGCREGFAVDSLRDPEVPTGQPEVSD